KVTIPYRKALYRLSLADGPVLDLMCHDSPGAVAPEEGVRIMCHHPFDDKKRVYVTPTEVTRLTSVVWDGKRAAPQPSLERQRAFVQDQLSKLRADHLRPLNPTPFKVSLSDDLFSEMHDLWKAEMPVA